MLVFKCMWVTSKENERRGQANSRSVAQGQSQHILESGHSHYESYSRVNKGNQKEIKGRREVGTINRNKPLACWGQGVNGCVSSNSGEVIVQGKKQKKPFKV